MSKVTLAEVVQIAVERRLAGVRVGMPGRIESFDPATQLARVKPLLRESSEGPDGVEVVESLPVISDVPVQFPGGGGFDLTFPVRSGDPCWLTFADRSLDVWIARGGDVDPVDVRRHHLSDAVAILGVRARGDALPSVNATAAEFGATDGARVQVGQASIKLGTGAVEALIKGNTYRTADTAFDNALAAAGGTQATAAGVAAGTLATLALVPVPTPADTKALMALLNVWIPTVGAFAAALSAAANAKETAAATCLSNISKTE